MTKKLAELLLQHARDCEAFNTGRKADPNYFDTPKYKADYITWKSSGQQCLDLLKEYGNAEYLASFYGNGKYNIYNLAEKYLNKLSKSSLQRKNNVI